MVTNYKILSLINIFRQFIKSLGGGLEKETRIKYLCKPIDKFNKMSYNNPEDKTYDKIEINRRYQTSMKGAAGNTAPNETIQAFCLFHIITFLFGCSAPSDEGAGKTRGFD